MWDYIFGLIPEKRQPGAVSVLAFFSITLPILAALAALAAWKLNDRLSRTRLPSASGEIHLWTPNLATEAETKKALENARTVLIKTEDALHKSEDALQKKEAELQETRAQAAKAVAAAGQRHITPNQKQRFLTASANRPVGAVGISAIDGDPESKAYAEQIREMLEDAGYSVGEELGAIRLRKDTLIGLRVGVFSKETAPSHALPLAANFIDADISAFPVINQRVPTGAVEVTVGTNPAAMNDDIPLPAPAPAPVKPQAEDPAPPAVDATPAPVATPVAPPAPTPVKLASPLPVPKEKAKEPEKEKERNKAASPKRTKS